MPEYAPGVPMWVDASSTDPDKARAFYKDLFGWAVDPVEDPQAGGYTMFRKDGKMVAGSSPTQNPDDHSVWSTYVCTTDAEATAQKAKDAGGQVLFGPIDVMGQGHLAILSDPTGAVISIWQPMLHTGAELVNEVGSFCWSELYTRDVPKAKEFYSRVFGWTTEETDMGGGGAYTLFQVDGRNIAGGLDMSKMLPAEVPPHWLVYFTVEDTNAAIEKVKQLGGTVNAGPIETPMGPLAVFSDPVGAVFAVIQMGGQES